MMRRKGEKMVKGTKLDAQSIRLTDGKYFFFE